MKKLLIIFIFFLAACNKDIVEINQEFPLLAASYADSSAGNWKNILGFNP